MVIQTLKQYFDVSPVQLCQIVQTTVFKRIKMILSWRMVYSSIQAVE